MVIRLNIRIDWSASQSLSFFFHTLFMMMRRPTTTCWLLAALILLASSDTIDSRTILTNLRTEYLVNPLGLDVASPRFSWEIVTDDDAKNVVQKEYHIVVTDAITGVAAWDTGVIASNISFGIAYSGAALKSGTLYNVVVSVTTNEAGSFASSAGNFSTGLFSPEDWAGEFIGASIPDDSVSPWFRGEFVKPKGTSFKTAFLYVASVGFCDVFLNAKKVTDAVLAPSISYLPKRVMYVTHDVKNLLVEGKNVIGLWASSGWADYMSFAFAEGKQYPQAPLVNAQLEMDGVVVAKTTSAGWVWRPSTISHIGPWGSSGSFGGDHVDNRNSVADWNSQTYDDSSWAFAQGFHLASNMTLSADVMERTKKQSSVPASSVQPIGDSKYLVTFNELFTGWFEVENMVGAPNSTVTFNVSTTSTVEQEFGMIDQYTFDGSGRGAFSMRFSYHSIRYITISGLAQAPSPSDITGWRLYSSLKRTGNFTSSSFLMNEIYETTVNNYLGLTTGGQTVDCPHRERRGYGGDAHTSYEFALQNFGVGSYFTKWGRDFADVQENNGHVPNTAPTVSGGGGPAWSGFVITMPFEVWRNYGDTSLLKQMYPTMVRLLDFFQNNTHSDGLLHPWSTSQWDFLGDWITPHGSEATPTSAENLLFNNAYVAYIERLAAEISSVLGIDENATKFRKAFQARAAAINTAFYNSSSSAYVDLLQTHIVMPLASGVVPDKLQTKVMRNLDDAFKAKSDHLDVGLTGNYFMTKLLTESGRNDMLFRITNQRTFPSYGYFLSQGYTSWPENWNVESCCKDTVSKMHGCYNAIGLWFIEGIAGINVDFRRSRFLQIRAGINAGDLTSAFAVRHLPQGIVSSSWLLSEGCQFSHNVSFPPNTIATVQIPAHDASEIRLGGKSLPSSVSVGGNVVIDGQQYVELFVGSGKFEFTSQLQSAYCR